MAQPRGDGSGPELTAGDRFGDRYDVVGTLGRGGMGAVLDVVDRATGRRAALKLMLPSIVADPELRARFDQEARLAARVESAHLVKVEAAGVDEATGAPYIVMERLDGEDVAARLGREARLAWPLARRLLRQLATGLDAMHAAGVVHRDLKPENLFLARSDDDEPTLKILDFGVAKLVALSATSFRSTRTLGSPLYMSPEQLEGDPLIDGRADVYAFGHLAFTLLVGQAYWERTWREARGVFPVLVRMMRGHTEPASVRAGSLGADLPSSFDGFFDRATAREPGARYDTAHEAWRALDAALSSHASGEAHRAVSAGPPRPGPTVSVPRRILGLIAALAAVLALAGMAMVGPSSAGATASRRRVVVPPGHRAADVAGARTAARPRPSATEPGRTSTIPASPARASDATRAPPTTSSRAALASTSTRTPRPRTFTRAARGSEAPADPSDMR